MAESPKIGAGHAEAMLRSGMKELTQALSAFPAQGIQPVEEPGLVGNPTNIEVVRGKEAEADPLESARTQAQQQVQAAERQPEIEPGA